MVVSFNTSTEFANTAMKTKTVTASSSRPPAGKRFCAEVIQISMLISNFFECDNYFLPSISIRLLPSMRLYFLMLAIEDAVLQNPYFLSPQINVKLSDLIQSIHRDLSRLP